MAKPNFKEQMKKKPAAATFTTAPEPVVPVEQKPAPAPVTKPSTEQGAAPALERLVIEGRKPEKKRFTLLLDPTLLATLQSIAERKDTSVNKIATALLTDGLKRLGIKV